MKIINSLLVVVASFAYHASAFTLVCQEQALGQRLTIPTAPTGTAKVPTATSPRTTAKAKTPTSPRSSAAGNNNNAPNNHAKAPPFSERRPNLNFRERAVGNLASTPVTGPAGPVPTTPPPTTTTTAGKAMPPPPQPQMPPPPPPPHQTQTLHHNPNDSTLMELQHATNVVKEFSHQLSRMADDANYLQDQVQHIYTLHEAEKLKSQELELELDQVWNDKATLEQEIHEMADAEERLLHDRSQLEREVELLQEQNLDIFQRHRVEEERAIRLEQQLNASRTELTKLEKEINDLLEHSDQLWVEQEALQREVEFMHEQNVKIHSQQKAEEQRALELEEEISQIWKEQDQERDQWESLVESQERQIEALRIQLKNTNQPQQQPPRMLSPGRDMRVPNMEQPSSRRSKSPRTAVALEKTRRSAAAWAMDADTVGYRGTP